MPATISARRRLDEIKRAVRRTLEVQLVARDNQRYRRELRERSSSAIRRLARSPLLLPEDIPPDVARRPRAPELPAKRMTLEELKRRYVALVLDGAGGNKMRAAELLDIDCRTLYRILERANDPVD